LTDGAPVCSFVLNNSIMKNETFYSPAANLLDAKISRNLLFIRVASYAAIALLGAASYLFVQIL
jgi:hypothetical protein